MAHHEHPKEPNPVFDKEKAEGSRETVNRALEHEADKKRRAGQGATNKPAEEEERQQAEVPPRGQRKGDVSA